MPGMHDKPVVFRRTSAMQRLSETEAAKSASAMIRNYRVLGTRGGARQISYC